MCSVFRQHKKLNHRNGDLNNKVMHTIFQDLPKLSGKKKFTSILWNHWNPIGIPLESHWNPIGPAEAQQGSGGPIQGAQHALPGGHQEVPRMPFWGRDNMVYMQEITGRSLGKRDV